MNAFLTALDLMGTLELPPEPPTLIGALLCFGLRFMAIRYGWRLPVAGGRDPTRRG